MKILKVIGIVLVVLIVILAVLAFVAPKEYDVERSIVIDAPRDIVFEHVKYWRNWKDWSPWAQDDTTMQVTIEGTDGQEGSVYKWVGDPDLTGSGRMTNTGVTENQEITYHLHFLEPWESESDGYVRLADAEGGVEVTWGFYGETPIPWNIFMFFASMDKMVGKDFERGLNLLKNICEKEMEAISSFEVRLVNFRAKRYAVIQKELSIMALENFFRESYEEIQKAMQSRGMRSAGAPAALYYRWDEQNMITDVAAAIPVYASLNVDEIKTVRIPSQKAYLVELFGPYSELVYAHKAMELYLQKNDLQMKFPVIEEYVADPSKETDSSKWLTKIYYFAE